MERRDLIDRELVLAFYICRTKEFSILVVVGEYTTRVGEYSSPQYVLCTQPCNRQKRKQAWHAENTYQ